jgi:hypothetical protein
LRDELLGSSTSTGTRAVATDLPLQAMRSFVVIRERGESRAETQTDGGIRAFKQRVAHERHQFQRSARLLQLVKARRPACACLGRNSAAGQVPYRSCRCRRPNAQFGHLPALSLDRARAEGSCRYSSSVIFRSESARSERAACLSGVNEPNELPSSVLIRGKPRPTYTALRTNARSKTSLLTFIARSGRHGGIRTDST